MTYWVRDKKPENGNVTNQDRNLSNISICKSIYEKKYNNLSETCKSLASHACPIYCSKRIFENAILILF